MEWSDLLTALGLVLVIEGVFPALNPEGVRRAWLLLAQLPAPQLRKVGIVAVLVGAAIVLLVRN